MELVNPTVINERLQGILDEMLQCLEDNTPRGAPPENYIYWTRPPDDCGHSLTIWLERLLPTETFPTVYGGPTTCPEVRPMARVHLKLVRDCWPVIKDNPTSPFPISTEMQEASESLIVDAHVMWCCLASGYGGAIGGNELGFHVESVVADDPRGGVAGVTATIVLELDTCC